MSDQSRSFKELVQDVKGRIHEIGPEDVRRKLDAGEPFHLVDVREESEWEKGRIPGATHLSKGVIERDIEKRIPERDAEIVCYCGGGSRSALAAENLQRMGYTNAASMSGGFRGWKEADLPTRAD